MIMSTISKSYNNTNNTVSNPEKNLWCREIYWKVIEEQLGFRPFKETNGCHLRSCMRKPHECRGAHDASELKPFKHIQDFNRLDKTTYNWSNMYWKIISCLQKDGSRVKSEEHKRLIANVSSMNFFEAIRAWRELACFYRKISKELPSQKTMHGHGLSSNSTGFTYSEDVPCFYLPPNIEDTAWSFVRITRWCADHQKFKRAIESKQLITIWDICLATGLNCKEGAHEHNEKICEEDFLTGKCSCQTIEQISAKQDEIEAEIIASSTKIQEIIKAEFQTKTDASDDGFIQPKKGRGKKHQKFDPKVELTHKICQLKTELEELFSSRLIHYSDFGMVPFNTQYKTWTEEKEAKEAIEAKKLAEAQPKVIIKESWDHGLVENAQIIKPVVKISKLGGKK